MHTIINPYLIAGGTLSAIAALFHLGCIVFGASWFRYLGAGERMAQMATAFATPALGVVRDYWHLPPAWRRFHRDRAVLPG